MNSYALGNVVRLTGAFATSAGVAIDPTVVGCQVRAPGGTITSELYGGGAVQREAAGSYYLDVTPDEGGEWVYRWYSTGTGQAAGQGVFTVEWSVFEEA